jgi:hypothetical protein
MVQVLFPKRDPDASAAELSGSLGSIHMDAIEDVAPLQGRKVVGLDHGEIHIVANNSAGVVPVSSMPRASKKEREKREP